METDFSTWQVGAHYLCLVTCMTIPVNCINYQVMEFVWLFTTVLFQNFLEFHCIVSSVNWFFYKN